MPRSDEYVEAVMRLNAEFDRRESVIRADRPVGEDPRVVLLELRELEAELVSARRALRETD